MRKKFQRLAYVLIACLLLAGIPLPAMAQETYAATLISDETVWDYAYTGAVQEFTAPAYAVYQLEVWGAQGGYDAAGGIYYYGGNGGYSVGYVTLRNGDTLYLAIGSKGGDCNYNGYASGGWNGGGSNSSEGGAGGGATHISTTNRGTLSNFSNNRNEVLIVAGGGGGGKTVGGWGGDGDDEYSANTAGSVGGGLTGGNSRAYIDFDEDEDGPSYWEYGPAGGSQTSGYAFGQGGTNAGGGWYGGNSAIGHYCGSGGSGYIGGVPSFEFMGTTYSPSTSSGVQSGNGKAKITLVAYYDTTPPVISDVTPTTTNWTNNDLDVTVEASDNVSMQLYYSTRSTTSITADEIFAENNTSGVVSVPTNGVWYIYVCDEAGNIAQTTITVTNIDKTAPTFMVSKQNDAIFPDKNGKIWTNKVNVSIEATDNVALHNTPYSFDGGAFKSNGEIEKIENGTYEVTVKDHLGNETSQTYTIDNIDSYNPYITGVSQKFINADGDEVIADITEDTEAVR